MLPCPQNQQQPYPKIQVLSGALCPLGELPHACVCTSSPWTVSVQPMLSCSDYTVASYVVHACVHRNPKKHCERLQCAGRQDSVLSDCTYLSVALLGGEDNSFNKHPAAHFKATAQ